MHARAHTFSFAGLALSVGACACFVAVIGSNGASVICAGMLGILGVAGAVVGVESMSNISKSIAGATCYPNMCETVCNYSYQTNARFSPAVLGLWPARMK
jgi:hypothetical protein